jgi:bisphosphoglycerate-dependent phosphoglycerate mutase
LLQSGKRVLIVGFGNSLENLPKVGGGNSLHLILSSGRWELLSNTD